MDPLKLPPGTPPKPGDSLENLRSELTRLLEEAHSQGFKVTNIDVEWIGTGGRGCDKVAKLLLNVSL